MASIPVAPPPPPAIAAQMAPPPPAFMTAGEQMRGMTPQVTDLLGLLDQKVMELEAWATDVMPILMQINPAMQAYMVPIAQAGKALKDKVTEMVETAQGGPAPGPGQSPQGVMAPSGEIPARAVA